MAQKFNDTTSVNGKVSNLGTTGGGGASPSTPTKATGRPKGVQESDGLNSPRVTVQTISGSLPSSPSGGSPKFKPAGVQSFKEDL